MKRYSTEEFRKQVVAEYINGDLTAKELAAKRGIPYGTLRKWVERYRDVV